MAKIFAEMTTDALVLRDVLIDGADGRTSQIDLILIGHRGVIVVEMKMFDNAKIYGDTKRSKWYYYKHGRKYEIYSPLMQNKKHVDYLKQLLKDFGDVPCFSIVTMVCEDFKISGDNPPNTIVCNSLPAMKRGLAMIVENNPIVFDDTKKQAIFEYIKKNQYSGKAARIEHKQRVIAYKESLEDMEKKKICPYCKTELVLRKGKNGEFYGCKNFPKCRYTLNK